MVNCRAAGADNQAVRVNNTGSADMFNIEGLAVWGSAINDAILVEAGTVALGNSQIYDALNGVRVASGAKFIEVGGNNFEVTNEIVIDGAQDTSSVQIAPSVSNKADGSSRVVLGGGASFGLASIAAASTLDLPIEGSVFEVTGNNGGTPIGGINGGWAGRVVTLKMTADPTFTHSTGGATDDVRLAGDANFSAAADTTLTILHDGTQWFEIGRAA
jgi:hypothetical protein